MNCPGPRALVGAGLILLLIEVTCAQNSGHAVRGEGPSQGAPAQAFAPQHLSPAGEAALRRWIDAGYLPDLRWPNFNDYRLHVKNFYEPAGYALAWTRDAKPTPQAVGIIEVFQRADSKGLEAEDYDASRWAERMARLRLSKPGVSDSDLAKFDLALTVCVMRYVSDLHIGKVNSKAFHFGLDIEHKKYNLPDFLRQRLVDTQNVKTVLPEVEPPFNGYRRTQNALQTYEDLAKRDDGEQIPVPKKPVSPGILTLACLGWPPAEPAGRPAAQCWYKYGAANLPGSFN